MINTLVEQKNYTQDQVMKAYNNAVKSGNISDANKLLTQASAAGLVSGVNKKNALETARGKTNSSSKRQVK